MVCHEPATTSQAFIRVSETDPDASPMGVSSGEWLGHVSEGIEDGPNVYAYVKQNPWTSFDAHGLWAEDLVLGVPSIGVGAASLWSNVKKGHVGSAIWDGVGIVLDAAAIATPGVPGGVGLATKAARLAAAKGKVEKAIDTAETVVDVGTAVATGDPTVLLDIVADKALDKAMGGKKKGSNNPTTASASKTGQEAHRQVQKELQAKGYQTEVPMTLNNGQNVRKDAVKDNEAVIIKPDTESGRASADKREKLMKEQSNLEPRTILYDPKDPKFQPGSSTFIGPKPKEKTK